MNQIIQQNFKKSNNYYIEFSNAITEIPYEENITHKSSKENKVKNFVKSKKYFLQFIISTTTALIFVVLFFTKVYKDNQQEKISKELLNNYNLSKLYTNSSQEIYNNTSPFVIGLLKIDKIDLNYPILSESNDELLKISICRFTGPMPNEVGNLCIAGHNYIDNRFFSRLNELNIGDKIEVYDFYGNKKDYTIFKTYEVEENDLSCTNQNVGNNNILTLLTCNNLDNAKRLVVQAH